MKKLSWFNITAVLLFLVATNCTSLEKKGADISTRIDTESYQDLLQKHTQHDLQYEGFYNKFEIYATFLNSAVQSAILQKRSDSLQWDTRQAQNERERLFQESSTQTKFAFSFYVPSARLNDLHKGSSIWKVYLVSGGNRYEGKVTKQKGKLEDIQAIYPYHNRWFAPYEVTFTTPLSGVESGPATLVISSTQGTTKLQY